jgi:hypothetical protein
MLALTARNDIVAKNNMSRFVRCQRAALIAKHRPTLMDALRSTLSNIWESLA